MLSKEKVTSKIMDYLPFILLTFAVEVTQQVSAADRKMLLSDIHVLTLYNGKMTNAKRSSPIPQVKCIGGTAGCNSFTPNVVQCYNRGSDGYDVQWECKTDMDNSYRFGRVEVSCEGYEYRDDPYILRGSCGLEYTLDLTEAGYRKKAQYGGSYYGSKSYSSSFGGYYKQLTKGTSVLGDVIMLVIVGLIIYAIYKTCIANQHYDGYSNDGGSDDYYSHDAGFTPTAPPPPPGFRPEFMPRGTSYPGGCRTTHNTNTRNNNNDAGFGGFWTGAALGGLAGYFFGNSGTGTHGRTRRRGGAWPTSGGWSSDSFSDSAFGSGSSDSTRTASGFGGTRRR